MTLKQAAKKFKVAGLDSASLEGQEDAFRRCLSFLEGIEKSKAQNMRRGSYGLKHLVENPGQSAGTQNPSNTYTGHVYEGTFILAALAAGFEMQQQTDGVLRASFNISERSLRRRVSQLAKQ
ncbi:MAG: hypothetical protein U1F98_13290 [Verrucomicrobiota bacterium]